MKPVILAWDCKWRPISALVAPLPEQSLQTSKVLPPSCPNRLRLVPNGPPEALPGFRHLHEVDHIVMGGAELPDLRNFET